MESLGETRFCPVIICLFTACIFTHVHFARGTKIRCGKIKFRPRRKTFLAKVFSL
ncbi:hypothetical protein PUN28_013641 [Cardiocondyla obscurior]|uniref:Uncharacterized protein n=1 Tax=Cardiocondyla obscurior TaxID=286306 RepID=A0AAW2F2A8_9HYME